MYYGRENTVSLQVGDDFIGYYGSNSEYSRGIEKIVLSTWGLCPPFSAAVTGNKFSGTLKIEFFNEFDERTIEAGKMRALIAAFAAATEDYEILEEYVGSKSLMVAFRKK